MSAPLALLGGAALGMAAGTLLVPLTRRELAASVVRSGSTPVGAEPGPETPLTRAAWVALAAASGLLPAFVLYRAGSAINAVPPLLLVMGLVQLAYFDLTRRLLPKTLVYALTTTVIISGVIVAALTHEWKHLMVATLCALAFFAVFFVVNLMNPRWMAFGDVRLSLVVGFGLAWVSPLALVEGFCVANILAAVIGVGLIAAHRAGRQSALPFGVYLAFGAALVLVISS